ncbi:hypothetical protein K491DRAFT_783790 [Lophiostoma macrostomum CBS 122681]|uniref:F-box domain-containing protein n=1 Tax=Lophiostoma macrostomum CBS 122681 TaxID=1314788 RepID=A0A6A6SLM9_9PLEO|nr:hypothetical protein K491DRAFT_783790 [Lophiostoma macrostomum CBS 122681]
MESTSDTDLVLPVPPNSLCGIPVEILQDILKDVERKDLATLAKVNHHLNSSAIPLLYEAFHPPEDDPYLFLRTILAAPELCAYVKRVAVHEEAFAVYSYDQKRAIGLQDRHLITSQLTQANLLPGVPVSTVYWNQQRGSVDKMILPTVLALLPEVTSLELIYEKEPSMCEGTVLWQSAAFSSYLRHRDVHAFTHLKSVQIHIHHAAQSVVVRLLAIPTLRALEFHGLVDFSEAAQATKTLSSNVEELKLKKSFADTSVLTALITACQHLKLFLYEHSPTCCCGDRQRMLHASNELDFTALSAALAHHKDSLTSVAVIDEEFPTDVRELRRKGRLDNLVDFPYLQNVLIPIWSVITHENSSSTPDGFTFPKVFPPKVKHLSLQITSPHHREYTRMVPIIYHPFLVAQLLREYLDLKSVAYGMMEYAMQQPPRFWSAQESSFMGAGLNFKRYNFEDVSECACNVYHPWIFQEFIHDWEVRGVHEEDHNRV